MSERIGSILCIRGGIGGLLFSRHYLKVGAGLLYAQGANVSISLVDFFLMRFFNLSPKGNGFAAAVYAFLVVSAQEIAEGLGLYPRMFDALDFVFNALGTCLALGIDILRLKKAV